METAGTKGYRNLIVWQKADELAFQIYLITNKYPKQEMFSLTSQTRRCALSVPANIVEGYARSTEKDKTHFCIMSRGSLTELEYYLDFVLRLNYITKDEYQLLTNLREEVGRLLNGYIKSLKKNS